MATIILKNNSDGNKRPDPALLQPGELAVNTSDTTPGLYCASGANLVKLGPVQVSSTRPNSSPSGFAGNCLGELWYDTSVNLLKVFDGSNFVGQSGPDLNAITGATLTSFGSGASTLTTSVGTYVGLNAGNKITVNDANSTAIGNNALANATQVGGVTAVGNAAARNIVTGGNIVAVGSQALELTTTISDVVAVGFMALRNAKSSANGSVAVGTQTLSAANEGVNTAIGYRALNQNTTGTYNTAVGFQAGNLITTGSNNTAIGYSASITGASNNNISVGSTPIGINASGNTIIGNNDGTLTLTGSNNLLVGHMIKNINAASSNSVVIGHNFNGGGQTLTGEVVICDGAGNVRIRINQNGAVSFGNSGYGNVGNYLRSNGSSGPPTWALSSVASSIFESADGKTITVEDGLITSIA